MVSATNWTVEYITEELTLPRLLLIMNRYPSQSRSESDDKGEEKIATPQQLKGFGITSG